jgi:hypothetical protein
VEKARNILSFHPQHDVRKIVQNLIMHMDRFSDWDNHLYYNIQTFRQLDTNSTGALAAVAL